MKTKLTYAIFMLLFTMNVVDAQELFQQSNIELEASLENNKTYLCQATSSIRLLPGFAYAPLKGNDMVMEIDRFSVFPPDEGYYGGNAYNDEGGVVGTLIGDFTTSNSGGAIYSIDLKLPPALGEMMPKLGIVYDNQGGNGLAGWGWNLSGLSSVTRMGKNEFYDGETSDINFIDDRFAIDGQRLIAENYSAYGENGTVYKTEIDNMDKIVSYTGNCNGPQYFKVWKSDGTIWEYGTTTDSRLESSSDNRIILKWFLSKICDRNGNAVCFHYHKNVSTGESYIKDIEYTSNESANVKPAYKVEFQYDNNRKDAWTGYMHGNPLSVKKLLKNIVVRNNYTQKVLLDYSLEYHEPVYNGSYRFMHYRLKSVGLTVDDKKINPTKIIWNSREKHYPSSEAFVSHELNRTTFSDVPFVGDFNGDGFSDVLTVPYKIQDTYSSEVTGKVYLNNGDGSFKSQPMTTVTLGKNLDWIYVIDLNNDGIDDMITYEFNYDYENVNDDLVTIKFYLMNNGNFIFKDSYSFKKIVSLIPGIFTPDKNGMLMIDAYDGKNEETLATYFYFDDGYIVKKDIRESAVVNGKDASHLAIDISGDGVSELITLYENDYKVFKMKELDNGFNYALEEYASGNSMNKDIYPFPNDFNGDGKVDVLYFDPRTYWNIAFSAGDNFVEPVSIVDNLLRTITLGPKDKYRFSLKELTEPSVAIRTSDFDGDGLSDVGVFKNFAGNYFLEIGFQPYKAANNTYNFTCQRRYYMPINYSHQAIHIGRFLAQENVSILSSLPRQPHSSEKAHITSLYPHSAYYSVERIVDGFGNARGFSYDYLMDRLADDDFYKSEHINLSYDIKTCGIPMSALKSDTVTNVNGKPVITNYEYENALLHTKGHGFLGFEKMTTRNYMDNVLVQRQTKEFEYMTMTNHAVALPSVQRLYYGENQLVKEAFFSFKKYECVNNPRIVVPFMLKQHEINYCFEKPNRIINNVVSENNYQTDTGDDVLYEKIVSLTSTITGYDNQLVDDPLACHFRDEVANTYDNNLNDWVVNRIKKVRHSSHLKTGDSNGFVQIFEYADKSNPLRVSKESKIPNLNENMSDPLLVTVEYLYDKVGNAVQQTISSPSVSQRKILKQEYGVNYQYRYPTKTFDEFGNVIQCQYDTDYGILNSTIDFNQYVTTNDNEPIGVTDIVTLSDGTQTAKALRWASGNEYAPQNASYYSWEKTTGKAESLIFYHSSGAELRTVTFDLKGKPVFVDKVYDDYGNVKKESLPYYQDGDKKYITYTYDKYNRLVMKTYPNNSYTSMSYDVNTVKTDFVSPEGVRQSKTDRFNAKEWLESTVDIGGNEVRYEYYSDGLVKSSQIGNNSKTKITLTYDNNRNRKTLSDPNYGLITYDYDAFGNIKKIISPNKNYTEYQYDASGRLTVRKERDAATNKLVTTQWQYSTEKGKIGFLNKVYTSDNHSIEYFYDDNLRLAKQIETIDNETYQTLYSYDEASRVSTITYPTGFSVLKTYSNSGYENAGYDNKTNELLWRTNETNANGNLTDYQLGNGSRTLQSFNENTFLLESIRTTSNNKIVQNLSYAYDGFGNLLFRKKTTGTVKTEEFEYDDYNRLQKIRLNGSVTGEMIYDNLGNITSKTINGVKVLYNAEYNSSRPHAIMKADTQDENAFAGFKQNVVYSTFDNVVKITEGNKTLDIDYGSHHNRTSMKTNVNGKLKTKTYVGDCEFVNDNGQILKLTYLTAPMGVFAVAVVDAKGNTTVNYVHKDNIGSWNVITDENGNVIQELSFDAWGNNRNANTWSGPPSDNTILYDRGFTGHEHLTDFGLINMNGRMYDPMMSMMLSPDNNIQMPQMSQNFNRYSYCLNNPLKYNDPNGEWVELVLTGVFSGFGNMLANYNKIDSWGEGLAAFVVGFAEGFLKFFYIENQWIVNVGLRTIASSLKYGVNEMVSISSGNFGFSGDDWNKIGNAACYGLGSGFFTSVMKTYLYPPTDEEPGMLIMDIFKHKEIGHIFTSLMSHSLGSWFSGQPFFKTVRFKDLGFDLEMLGYMAKRLLAEYVFSSLFADKALNNRSLDIKQSMLDDIRKEDPEHPDFDMLYELTGVTVEFYNVYIYGDVFALLPGEVIPCYPKPYLEEIVVFPFSFSLFRSLFFTHTP